MLNEAEIAQQIATGEAPSPTRCGTATLWAMRVTGTGLAYRKSLDEYVRRDPAVWLTDETLARLPGLPCIWEHPEDRATLDTDEYAARVIGAIMHPYIADENGVLNAKGPDIWAIVRVHDDDANGIMVTEQLSTSPAVVFRDPSVNETRKLEDGSTLLVEGDPSLIDHLAICDLGVWDKAGPPIGIRNDYISNEKEDTMPDDNKILAALDAVTKTLGSIGTRLDALEAAKQAPTAKEVDGKIVAPGETGEVAADADADRANEAENAAEQLRADSVYRALGMQAPAPLAGEKPWAFRRRLAAPLQRHCDKWKALDLNSVKGDAFFGIRDEVYADAQKAGASGAYLSDIAEPGQLLERRVPDDSGRMVSTFHGKSTIFSQMNQTGRRVTGFNTKFPG